MAEARNVKEVLSSRRKEAHPERPAKRSGTGREENASENPTRGAIKEKKRRESL